MSSALLDIFKKMDALWETQRREDECFPLFMGRCLTVVDSSGLSNILTYKNLVSDAVAQKTIESGKADEVCRRLDQLCAFLEKYFEDWMLLEEYRNCRCCADVFRVFDSVGAAKNSGALEEADLDKIEELLRLAGDSDYQKSEKVLLDSVYYTKTGELKFARSVYLKALEEVENKMAGDMVGSKMPGMQMSGGMDQAHTGEADYADFKWDLDAAPRLFYVGPGHDLGALVSECMNPVYADTPFSAYNRLVFLKAILGGKIEGEGLLWILPPNAPSVITINTCMGTRRVGLKKYMGVPNSPTEQEFLSTTATRLSKYWGSTELKNGPGGTVRIYFM